MESEDSEDGRSYEHRLMHSNWDSCKLRAKDPKCGDPPSWPSGDPAGVREVLHRTPGWDLGVHREMSPTVLMI